MTREEVNKKITVAYDDEDGRMYRYEYETGDRIQSRSVDAIIDAVLAFKDKE